MKRNSVTLGLIILFFDQISKVLIDNFLLFEESMTIIDKFFYFTKVYNTGASWSILQGHKLFLIIISFIALIILACYQKDFKDNYYCLYSFGLIYGGLLGNLLDRIVRGYVIDFIHFNFGNWTFPIFNVADICLVIGFIIMSIAILKGEDKNEVSSK